MSVKVIDFFSGCGGTSAGLRAAGMDIVLGLDNDPDAGKTFATNFSEADFIGEDVRQVHTDRLAPYIDRYPGSSFLFSGCAPCQPFSKQNTLIHADDERILLLDEFGRFVERYRPAFVFVENVPKIQRIAHGERHPFQRFINMLCDLGYGLVYKEIDARAYGVPQRRKRLVLLARLHEEPCFPAPTHGPATANPSYASVWDWIGDLPPIAAGEEHLAIPNHRAAHLSALNLRRIRATPEGGSRGDWPPELRLECHSKGYTGHTDVYGRMRERLPASGLTTRCISLSNGRFGHPRQDRAISVREAACLQTFPRSFIFHGSLNSMARQIGNAVPVLLAQRFGECVLDTLTAHPCGDHA